MNEELIEVVAEHPARFGAFATVPQENPEAAIEETIYALDRLGCDGIAATPSAGGAYLGDPAFDPWLEVLDSRGAVLFIHPMAPPGFKAGGSGTNLNVAVLEFSFESTRAVANMALSRVNQRFPNLRIILTHGAGALPLLAPRVAMSEPLVAGSLGREPLTAEELRDGFASFYYDLTASTNAIQLDVLRRARPAADGVRLATHARHPRRTGKASRCRVRALQCPRPRVDIGRERAEARAEARRCGRLLTRRTLPSRGRMAPANSRAGTSRHRVLLAAPGQPPRSAPVGGYVMHGVPAVDDERRPTVKPAFAGCTARHSGCILFGPAETSQGISFTIPFICSGPPRRACPLRDT